MINVTAKDIRKLLKRFWKKIFEVKNKNKERGKKNSNQLKKEACDQDSGGD